MTREGPFQSVGTIDAPNNGGYPYRCHIPTLGRSMTHPNPTEHQLRHALLRSRRIGGTASLAALVLATTLGCSSGEQRPRLAEPAEPTEREPFVPAPCVEGAERSCSVILGEYAGVLSCYYGTQECVEGTWGECVGGGVASRAALGMMSSVGRLLSLSSSEDCEADPCDPGCQNFDEVPDEPVIPDEQDPIFIWTSGSLGSLPGGLADKGIVQPCGSGYDCQFNHICVEPKTSSTCAHSKCAVGVGLDPECDTVPANQTGSVMPCVAEICLARPECCIAARSDSCDHDPCVAGESLKSNCSAAVGDVCDALESCCEASSTVGSGDSSPLVAEAENAAANVSQGGDSWTQQNNNSASGNRGMQATPDNGTRRDTGYIANSPRLDFPFNFSETGTWYVWVRGKSVDNRSNSDSVHVGLDLAAQPDAQNIDDYSQSFGWERGSIEIETAGRHTVNVWMREDGFWFDKIVLSPHWSDAPSGEGPDENGMVSGGAWTSECVELYQDQVGVSCAQGSWTQDCVDMVKTVCAAECAPQPVASCAHAVCSTGVALDGLCHPCVSEVCALDPTCCITGWDQDCVNRVPAACGMTCPVDMHLDPPETGRCVPRLPGDVDESCAGVDLSVAIPCDGVLPVCNHGTVRAPDQIRVVHFPANSQQYPLENPEIKLNQAVECFTAAPIEPGRCINVTGCLPDNGNREVMVNPSGDPRFTECSRKDNWALFSAGQECQEPVCSESATEAAFKKVHLYVIMDKSGSMAWSGKWTGSVGALKTFFGLGESAGLNVALEFFPLSDDRAAYGDGCGDDSVGECDAVPCSSPMVPGAELTSAAVPADTQEAALGAALDALGPGGMTPSYPALDGALRWARAGQTADDNSLYAVVMVTDGEPTVCNTNTTDIARLALTAYLEVGIRTYAIGMEGADIAALNKVALAGGTGSAFVVGSGDSVEQDLLEAFRAISGDLARCQFDISNSDYIEPRDATVLYAPSATADPVELELVDGADDCSEGGWYYDDLRDPTKAVLCPSTCTTVEANPEARVSIRIGCATPYQETDMIQTYTSECDPSQGTQWGYLSWESDTPGDSKITFYGRSAPSSDDFTDLEPPWVELEVVQESAENEMCPFGGDPDCTVALYPPLGGIPGARLPVFQLKAVLTPTSDLREASVLNRWEVSYTCLDHE